MSERGSQHTRPCTSARWSHSSLLSFRYTRLTLLQETEQPNTANGFTDVGKKAGELESVELSILNHRELLRQVTSYPNRKLKQPDFLPYDLAESLSPITMLPPEPCPVPSTSTPHRSERCLKTLQELCNVYYLSLMKEQLADTERRLRGERSALQTARVTRSLSRRLGLTNFLFELWSPEDEEEEAEEGAEGELHKEPGEKCVFTSEPLSLESFCSCVEEIPIKLEAQEVARTVTPDPGVAMETAGSVSSGDSIEVLGTEKSYRTQQVAAASDSRGTSSCVTSSCLSSVLNTDDSIKFSCHFTPDFSRNTSRDDGRLP